MWANIGIVHRSLRDNLSVFAGPMHWNLTSLAWELPAKIFSNYSLSNLTRWFVQWHTNSNEVIKSAVILFSADTPPSYANEAYYRMHFIYKSPCCLLGAINMLFSGCRKQVVCRILFKWYLSLFSLNDHEWCKRLGLYPFLHIKEQICRQSYRLLFKSLG